MGWTCDLVPKPLMAARYFTKEQIAAKVAAHLLKIGSYQRESLNRCAQRKYRMFRNGEPCAWISLAILTTSSCDYWY